MGLIGRIRLIVTWMICVALYLLVVAGVMNPIYGFAVEMDAVRNGPFWEVFQNIIWAGTFAVPALLILSPIIYWIVANVREETNEYAVRPRP
ncbi:hypothetical protein [Natrinema sp. DC36]|uniref:hypothetical protein n=1 Tax=Natrinema sp. DC36 TaxID=2878680 RepID=UPI001CF05E34|nr:hypothetical protein [Natrinema sp. DC36]